MNDLRQAAQQALEALERAWGGEPLTGKEMVAIAALRAALAEPEQEPVCDKDPGGCWNVRCQLGKVCKNTAPTPRKPLTDEEIERLEALCIDPVDANGWGFFNRIRFARAIERAHGIGE